ncbi:MAG: sugar phosphate nucleotidyltransferase [bacterium]|nr:sugar phosphate nucleotidyltransferase [bacterium]
MAGAAHFSFTFSAEGATVRDVLSAIQEGSMTAAFAIDGDGRLAGMMTDGDVRRALLAGASVTDSASPFISRMPIVAHERESRSAVLDLMRAQVLSQLPVVNDAGQLVGVHTLQSLIGRRPRPNTAVIFAGGRGTRLHPLTRDIPKAMVPVAGRPVLERIVAHLVGHGVLDIVLAVGHLSEPIEAHFRDGEPFGCRIRYLHDDPDIPGGTCGPLARLGPLLDSSDNPILVMNGDLVTSIDVGRLLDEHAETAPSMTVATKGFPFQVPYAVVEQDGGVVHAISEKPIYEHEINIGVYALDRTCLARVPVERRFDMTDLIAALMAEGQTVRSWSCDDDWIDIGSPADLGRARGLA